MSDLTSSMGRVESRVAPIVENLLQKHTALRVALVHPPSSANQALELKEALAVHGVTDCEIMKVSSISAAAAPPAPDLAAGAMERIQGWLARHFHRERAGEFERMVLEP